MGDRDLTKQGDGPMHRRFACPICERRIDLPTQGTARLPRFFPFCSERCKLIDLGAWFDADYRIPAKPEEESVDSVDPDSTIDNDTPSK